MSALNRTAVSLDLEEARKIRLVAANFATNGGLVIRALVKYGLAHLDDADVKAALQQEIDQERARRAEVGRAAMESRYGKKPAPRRYLPIKEHPVQKEGGPS